MLLNNWYDFQLILLLFCVILYFFLPFLTFLFIKSFLKGGVVLTAYYIAPFEELHRF